MPAGDTGKSRAGSDEAVSSAAVVAIRQARPDELPALMEMWSELDREQSGWRVFTPRQGFREQIEAHYRAAAGEPGAMHVVAEDQQRLVGMALGELIRPSSFSDEQALEMSSVFVRPSHRGRGIGRALVLDLARFARHNGVDRVTLKTFAQNRAGLRFWEGLGFGPRVIQLTARVDELVDGA